MDYAEARAAFFSPRPEDAAPAGSSAWRSPARALRDAIEPIATICFWAEPAFDADVVVEHLRRGASAVDATGRPMTAGLLSLDWPDDHLGRLWHACTILR